MGRAILTLNLAFYFKVGSFLVFSMYLYLEDYGTRHTTFTNTFVSIAVTL